MLWYIIFNMKENIVFKIFVVFLFFCFPAVVFAEAEEIGETSNRVLESDVVEFHLAGVNSEVICLKDVVNITNIKVSSKKDIENLEYSIDGGLTWVELDAVNLYKEVTFNLPQVPFDVGLLVLKLRATVDGQRYVSIDKYIPTSCGEALILGYYFENKDESAIISQSGDILLNPNHDLKIFVETSYGISEVKVFSGEDSFSLNYDYSTKIWSGVIPRDFLLASENVLEIVGRSGDDIVKKYLPKVYNTSFFVPELEELYGKYEVYYFDDNRWELIDYAGDELNYPIFTVLPGKYYIKLQKEGGWFYSTIFEVRERTIVALNVNEVSFPVLLQWFERYFSSLPVVLFDSKFVTRENLVEQDIAGVKDYFSKNERDSVVLYINRWNPLYRQTLTFLQSISDDYNIVLLTERNNFSSLSSSLKVYGEFMELHEVKDGMVLRNFLSFQPQIVYYSVSDDSFSVVYSLHSFINLLNNLERD